MLWLFNFHKNYYGVIGTERKKIMDIAKEKKKKSGPRLITQAQQTATKTTKTEEIKEVSSECDLNSPAAIELTMT